MERQFNNGDFEKLLKNNANQYRMYPSEKVWKGIDSALHTRRRWYGLTAVIMVFITASIIAVFVFNNKPDKVVAQSQLKNKTAQNKTIAKASVTPVKQTKFSPEIPETKSAKPPVYRPEAYLPDLAFNTLSTSAELREDLDANNSPATNNESAGINSVDKKEPVIEASELLLIELKIENNNIKPEIQQHENVEINPEKNIADQKLIDEETEKKINEAIAALASQNISLPAHKKQPKVTAQVFFTPTVSYRNLTENKKVYTGNGFNYVPVIDLNNMVKHKPAMGLEFGIEGKYKATQNISFKTGLQFNINRYDIRAYSHPTEIATVAINSGYRVDSLASLSNYRNFNGNSPNWLENFYFQVAIPVGAEIILSDKNDFQWGLSGTIQPTYVIGDRAYVISSDYKNYAKFPNLMRQWNLSTSVGTFVSYSTGRIRWQAGPQVRYQHLSSFVSALTVKEKLFSVGLRVGATLNKKK